eukprot:jgi/Mesvir1/8384/Mv12629-RA.1
MSAPARSAFRGLLRAQKIAFKKDVVMQNAATAEIRRHFDESRNETDAAKVSGLLAQAAEAAEFLKSNVIQAALNERGNYEMDIRPEHAGKVAEPAVAADLSSPGSKGKALGRRNKPA